MDQALPNHGLWRKASAGAINLIIVAGLGGGELQLVVMICAQIEHNPMIGRAAINNKRELVIGRRSHGYVAMWLCGYVAMYRYFAEIDSVFVLAIRSQKEAGDEER